MSRSNSATNSNNNNNNNKWSPNEEESCIRALDRLVVATRQNHDQESNMPDSQNDQVLDQQRAREMQELRLFAEAVHGQDVIGLTALTTGFWSHKNALSRQKHTLEKVLPKKHEAEEILENLRRIQLAAEDSSDVQSCARLIDTVQRANFVELARYATEVQRRLCEYSPMVAAYQALGGNAVIGNKNSNTNNLNQSTSGVGLALNDSTSNVNNSTNNFSPSRYNSGATASALSRPAGGNLALSEEGQENRLGECVRIADASLQDAEMRANQLREQLAGLFDGFEQLKLPKAMHSFIPRSIAAGEASAPRATSMVVHQNVSSVSRQTSLASPNRQSQQQQPQPQPHPLLNGYTTMHLLRVLCVEASVNDTAEGLASQFGVENHCVTDVHQQPLEPTAAFQEPTKVLIHIGQPMRGLEESLVSLYRRIDLIEKTTLPRAKERLIGAREALWSAELQALQAPLKGDSGVTERRRAVEQLERDQKRAEEVLEQCRAHQDALLGADFGRISFLLEAKQLEALEGLGASERLIYTCKEVPKGVSISEFAERLGVPVAELITFVDEENEITMAYVPTLVPRKSLMILDEELRKEFSDYKTAHPELPPRTDLMEHLSALRAGDVATLSNMLLTARKELEASEPGKNRVALQEAEVTVGKLREQTEQNTRVIAARDDTILLLRTQNDELRTAVSSAKERADAADGALQTKSNESADLDQACSDLQNRCNALTENLQATEHRCHSLQRELQELQQEHQRELENHNQNSQDEKDLLSANRSAMESQIDQLASKVEQQQSEITSQIKKIDALTQQRDEARNNAETLRTRLAETNVEVKNSATIQSERNLIQGQLDQATANLAETTRKFDEEVDQLKQQIKQAEGKAKLFEDRYKQLEEDTNKAKAARDNQLSSVHDKYKQSEQSANAAREAAEQETAVLRRQLQNVTADLATVRARREQQSNNSTSSSPSSPLRNSNNNDNHNNTSLVQPGVQSPSRGLLDPAMASGTGASPNRKRVVYVCRPLPRGTTPSQLAAEFGVSLADLLGPFTETHSGDKFCYVPTIADSSNSDIVREDERIRNSILESAQNNADGNGLPSVVLLEALHALRSGDIASLAQKVLDGEERVAKAEALLALQARSDALAGVSGTRQSMPELDVTDTQALLDDDHTHDSVEILREKIELLKEALASMRNRMDEWKALADDYKQQLIAEQADDVDAEQVKAHYEQVLERKLQQIRGLEAEVGQLRKDLESAEQRKDEELQVLTIARQKLVAEKDQNIVNLKRQVDDLRNQNERMIRLLNENDDQ